MDMLRYIEKRFEKEGMIIPESQAVQFEKYFKILIETNKVMNLTAITEFKAVVEKHFLDSALLSKYIDFREVKIHDRCRDWRRFSRDSSEDPLSTIKGGHCWIL